MKPKITKTMTFQQILEIDPRTAQVLKHYNLGCAGCLGAPTESLEQGARAHGLDADEILTALNALFED
jgi:hybrid cluster-associated redox disulfide protein